jgi:DNA primase
MYYPEDLVEEIRSSSDIVDVISGYIKLDRKGNSFFGLCPFHNEKTPSFSVSRYKQMYYCFGCGVGGNAYTFIMSYENFTFVEAVKYLAERSNIKLPEIEYSKEAREKADLKSALFEINKLAGTYFYYQLKNNQGQRAYEYLKERQLSEEMIVGFGLGYSNQYKDDLFNYLKGKGYSEDIIRQSGLILTDEKHGNYDRFWNRIMFPIMDPNSKVIGFGGRVMGEGKPKYLNSPETPVFDKSRNLYGISRARISRKPYFLVCEGYFDVIHLHQHGYTNSVATLGTALTYGHANLMKRYVDEVYLTYDNDEAGIKAALRSIPILTDSGLVTRVIDLKPYKDPDELLNNLGAKELEKRIKSAKNGFMFGLEMLEREYRMDTPEDKTRFFKEVATRLITFEDEMERNNYIDAVSGHYRVSRDSLHKLVVKTAISQGLAKPATRVSHPGGDNINSNGKAGDYKRRKQQGLLNAQKLLLTLMISDKNVYEKIKHYIQPVDYTEQLYQTVAKFLYQQLDEDKVNPSAILNHFTDESSHQEVAGLFYAELKDIESDEAREQAVKEAVVKMKSNSIEKRRQEANPYDMDEWQKISNEKRMLEELMSRKVL